MNLKVFWCAKNAKGLSITALLPWIPCTVKPCWMACNGLLCSQGYLKRWGNWDPERNTCGCTENPFQTWTGNQISWLQSTLGGRNRLEWDLITFVFQLLQKIPQGINCSDPAARYVNKRCPFFRWGPEVKWPEGGACGDPAVSQVQTARQNFPVKDWVYMGVSFSESMLPPSLVTSHHISDTPSRWAAGQSAVVSTPFLSFWGFIAGCIDCLLPLTLDGRRWNV